MENVVQKSLDILASSLKSCEVFKSIEEVDRETGKCVVVLSGKSLKDSIEEFVKFLDTVPEISNVSRTKDEVKLSVPLSSFEGVGLDLRLSFKSEAESEKFKTTLEGYSSEERALLEALVSAILYEEDEKKLFSKIGIGKIPELQEGQHYEFELTDESLCLKVVDEEQEEYIVWESSDWEKVELLLKGFDLSKGFDEILSIVSSLGSKAKNKVLSTLTSSLSSDSEIYLSKANSVLGEVELSEQTDNVAFFIGEFRPPHALDFKTVEHLGSKNDRVIVCILRENIAGKPVTVSQSEKIWKIYKKYFNFPVEIRVIGSEQDVVDLVKRDDLKSTRFTVVSYIPLNLEKEGVQTKTVSSKCKHLADSHKFSSLKSAIDFYKKGKFIPKELNREDFSETLKVLLKVLNKELLQESVKASVRKVVEGSSGTPIRPATNTSSEDKSKLAAVYRDLYQQLGSEFNINFHGTRIIISTKHTDGYIYDHGPLYEEENQAKPMQQGINYVPYMASYIKFLQESGRNVDPLPHVILNVDDQEGDVISWKTGHYNPEENVLTVYSKDRNPKDVLRSFAHEMEHHIQCLEGRLKNLGEDSSTVTGNSVLEEIEAEAYQNGNVYFRKWTESKRV